MMLAFNGMCLPLVIVVAGCAAFSESVPTQQVEPRDAQVSTDASAGEAPDAAVAPVPVSVDLASQVSAKLSVCIEVSTGLFKKDEAQAIANLRVCASKGAVYFAADMDIDCDGKVTAVCNRTADKSFQPTTAGVDSAGNPLDASVVPYIVVPGVSSRLDYKAQGIKMGSLVAVLYQGKMAYGIVGDVGPSAILGEASYAMARALGINPNPATGGVSSGVTYLIFTGQQNVVSKLEDTAEAKTKGEAAVRAWLTQN
jgi:Fungal chitosanase of glycosyl hydrolase group 75